MFANLKFTKNLIAIVSNTLPDELNLTMNETKIITNVIAKAIIASTKLTISEMDVAERAGPCLWGTIHWLALVADKEKKKQLYINLLGVLLEGHPCKELCRPHMKRNLQLININNYASCFEHSVDIHNLVNKQLQKPTITQEEARIFYNLDCAACSMPTLK